MHEYRKRQPTGTTLLRFFALGAGTLLLFMLSVVVVRAAWGMYDTFKVAVDARVSAEGQLASLKASEARLKGEVESFATPKGVEYEVRERFGVAKPGEEAIQIIRQEASTTTGGDGGGNFLQKLFGSFFGW